MRTYARIRPAGVLVFCFQRIKCARPMAVQGGVSFALPVPADVMYQTKSLKIRRIPETFGVAQLILSRYYGSLRSRKQATPPVATVTQPGKKPNFHDSVSPNCVQPATGVQAGIHHAMRRGAACA